MGLSTEIEAMLEALDEDYVNIWPALRVLMRRDERVRRAVELLENDDVESAVELLRRAGLEDDQIVYIISTVRRVPLEDAEELYEKASQATQTVPRQKKEKMQLNTYAENWVIQQVIQLIAQSPGMPGGAAHGAVTRGMRVQLELQRFKPEETEDRTINIYRGPAAS